MDRKSVIVVRWKNRRKNKVEAYGSLVAFCATHQQYTRNSIYLRMVEGVFSDHALELQRVPFRLNPKKTRRGNLPRVKPGPKGPRKKKA